MAPEKMFSFHIKGVERVTGRMVERDVKRLEIVVLQFDLGTVAYLEAETFKDTLDRVERLGDGVQVSPRRPAAGEGDVEPSFSLPWGLTSGATARRRSRPSRSAMAR